MMKYKNDEQQATRILKKSKSSPDYIRDCYINKNGTLKALDRII